MSQIQLITNEFVVFALFYLVQQVVLVLQSPDQCIFSPHANDDFLKISKDFSYLIKCQYWIGDFVLL